MPSQNPDSEIQFVVIILLIAILVFVLMLAAIFAALLSKAGTANGLKSISLPVILAALFPKHKPKVAEGSTQLFPKDGPKKELTSGQRALKAIGSVFLTAALMFGLTRAIVYAYHLTTGGYSDFFSQFRGFGINLIGTAVGGAIGVRISRLSWRQTIVAALLSGVGWIVLSRFEFSPLLPGAWYPTDSGMVLDLDSFLIGLFSLSAPVFLLPLFDPAVRQAGPAPSPGRVALAAFSLATFIMLIDFLGSVRSFQGLSDFGLIALLFGSILSAVLVGIGLILGLVNLTAAGARLGGLGVVLEAVILTSWCLLGTPWFP